MNSSEPNQKPTDFSDLLRCYGDMAYRMAYQLTGGREPEARDLVQDAFIKIWRHWDVQQPESFKGWMYRLMHNLYMDSLRKKYRHPTLSLDAPAPESETAWEQNLPDGEPSLDDGVERLELQARVAKALGTLDVEFRTVIVLCDMEGLAYDEIALVVGCPIGTIRSRIHRGRTQLRRILGSSPSARTSAGASGETTGDPKITRSIGHRKLGSPVDPECRQARAGEGGPQSHEKVLDKEPPHDL